LPCALSPKGLPIGLQLVAAPFAEETLLRAAAWCERALGRGPRPLL
jgi:Asp-tRNA(Asn)/Glu-tRNA(Gln) amidotransferase A subunit family amidase